MEYGRPDLLLKPARNIEYEAFAKVTRELSKTWKTRETNFPAFINALHQNQTLWQIIASDVANSKNGLPESLRARLFYLYEFVEHHFRKVVNGAEEEIDILIEINTSTMRGLRGQDRAS